MMTSVRASRGVSVLGAIVAVMILAAMGGAMAVLVATNQETRSHQYFADQAFASAQAGIEVALGLISNGASPCDSMNRNLRGDSLMANSVVVSRMNSHIYATGTKGVSAQTVSIVDPHPPADESSLVVDASNAKDASNGAPAMQLIDIAFRRASGCENPVTITSLTISWNPRYGEVVQEIQIDGNNAYSAGVGGGTLSGEPTDIADVAVVDAAVHMINFIMWDMTMQNRLYTIQFNFADGSSKMVSVNTL